MGSLIEARYAWQVNHVWQSPCQACGGHTAELFAASEGSRTWRSRAPQPVEGDPVSGLGDYGEGGTVL